MKSRLLLLFFLLGTSSYSQGLFRYTYDAAGNRTVRRYSISMLASEEDEIQLKEEKNIDSKMLKRHHISVLTNIANDEILVRISNLKNETVGEITTYSISGTLVAKIKIREENTIVDLSDQPAGVYIMRINIEGEISGWKVTKTE